MSPQSQRVAAPESADLSEALSVLANDGLVAFPTETVWGVAARASSPLAIARLRALKLDGQRDASGDVAMRPFSVMVSGLSALAEVDDRAGATATMGAAVRLSPAARVLAERYWPGPLTLIVSCRLDDAPGVVAPGVAAPGGGLGLRCAAHPVALELAREAERLALGPLTATSLNRSGEPPVESRVEASRFVDAGDRISHLCSGEAFGGAPSTVVDVTGRNLVVVREGAIPSRDLLACVASIAWIASEGAEIE